MLVMLFTGAAGGCARITIRPARGHLCWYLGDVGGVLVVAIHPGLGIRQCRFGESMAGRPVPSGRPNAA
jgi:hypothetical protein